MPGRRGHVLQKKLFDNGLNLKTTGDSAIVVLSPEPLAPNGPSSCCESTISLTNEGVQNADGTTSANWQIVPGSGSSGLAGVRSGGGTTRDENNAEYPHAEGDFNGTLSCVRLGQAK